LSQKLVDRSPDLKRLRDEGFDIKVVGTHLLVGNIPYVNDKKEVKRGILVSTLEFTQNNIKKPDEHTVQFAGERPCDKNGVPLAIIHSAVRQTPVQGVETHFLFSTKPRDGKGYPDYYAKMTTYAKILMHEAQAIDPAVKAQVFPVIAADADEESPFKYFDTSSSRAGIAALSSKLAMTRIAIVGLGGTGSYILDFTAKTPVREIHLFDDDDFCQHTAFRCPGALGIEDLKPGMKKVEYYRDYYSRFRHGVIAHPYRIDMANRDELRQMEFVFLCLDSGELKDPIMRTLEDAGIRFIDVGMGIQIRDDALSGILRATTSTPAKRDHVRGNHRISFAPALGPNDYSRNIQVADLNALNAALAVIKWKKLCGFYHDLMHEHHSTYVLETSKVGREDPNA
jgi:ThiF family